MKDAGYCFQLEIYTTVECCQRLFLGSATISTCPPKRIPEELALDGQYIIAIPVL
jgi:hypothetical protein